MKLLLRNNAALLSLSSVLLLGGCVSNPCKNYFNHLYAVDKAASSMTPQEKADARTKLLNDPNREKCYENSGEIK